MKNIDLAWGKTYHSSIAGEHWTGFIWHYDIFVIKSVWFTYSKFSEVTKMIYKSTWDVYSIVFVPNLAIQSPEFDQKTLCKLHKNFSHVPKWLYGLDLALISCCMQETSAVFQMAGKFKMFFWYQFMNLIFIYFSKRGEAVIIEGLKLEGIQYLNNLFGAIGWIVY